MLARAFLTLAALALALPAVAGAQQSKPRNAEYVDLFTTRTPDAGTGRRARTDLVNPDDPNAKPPPFSRVLVEFHPGTVFDTDAIPQCTASDPELLAQGPAACPQNTHVGTGELHLDTGFPDPFRIVVNDFTFINADEQLILLARTRDFGSYFVVRGRLSGNKLDVELPPLPGTPPDGGASTREILNLGNFSTVQNGQRRYYAKTPPTCPASRQWTNRVTYWFRDGVVQTFTTTSPCDPPAVRPPTPKPKPRPKARPKRRSARSKRCTTRRSGSRRSSRTRRAKARQQRCKRRKPARRRGARRGDVNFAG